MGIIHHWGLKGTDKTSRGRAQPCDNCQDMSQPWNMWSSKTSLKKWGENPQTMRGTANSLVMMVNDCTSQCTCMCVVTYCEPITWESFEGHLTCWLVLPVLWLTWPPRTRTRLSHNAHKYFCNFLRPQLRTDLLHPIQFLSSGLLWFNEPQPQCV